MPALKRFLLTVGIAVTAGGCATATPSEKASTPEAVPSVNPNFAVSEDKAAAGWIVWRDKACHVCHSIGKGNNAGPDLFGVVERRDLEWLKKFLLDTTNMLESDPIANAMFEQYRFQRMPNMRLTEQQVENLTHYIQRETLKRRSSD